MYSLKKISKQQSIAVRGRSKDRGNTEKGGNISCITGVEVGTG